jgi:hypothetical protein
MKDNSLHNVGRLVALTVVSLVLLSCALVVAAAAETSSSLSKKELTNGEAVSLPFDITLNYQQV